MEYRISLEARALSDAPGRTLDPAREAALAPRVAVVCDLREENWFSMNLIADMLLGGLRRDHAGALAAERVCPPMRRRFSRAGCARGRR
ncbi:MAG: hypothetical protein M3416_08420, partial [Acidobacteriota bacterium]|nr:hypothetical protein [Acidobacteriota bacterium]